MKQKDYDAIMKALDDQLKEVTSSRKAARKFLKDAGVWHLFVPKKSGKSKSVKASQ